MSWRSEALEKLKSGSTKDGDCLIWMRGHLTYGYGFISIGRKRTTTHRLAWELLNGSIPKGMCVLHRCDNPPCWRIDHLFLGTKADNTHDMLKKGRHGCQVDSSYIQRGDAHYSRQHPERLARGSRHGNAKLSEEDVIRIHKMFYEQKMLRYKIAEQLHLSRANISDILNHKSWKHVQYTSTPPTS